jgi:uncharacterized membrane protein YbhN (UPF0104 family)
LWWRRLSRAKRIAIVAIGVALFLAISGLLARFLSTENAERADILKVLQAQARGDAPRVLALLQGCSAHPSCVASVRASASSLRRPGSVKILSITSPTAGSLTTATGTSRVAWTVIGRLPVVQCVALRRSGNFLKGFQITLLSLSAPIGNEADC